MLDLARDLGTLECAKEGVQLGIVAGVQGVQDGLGQRILTVQLAQDLGQRLAGISDGDGVKAGVGAQLGVHGGVDVPQAGEVNLHGPAPLGVFPCAVQQQVSDVGVHFPTGQRLAGHGLLEDGSQLLVSGLHIGNIVQAVVGSPAAVVVKVGDPLGQSLPDALDAAELIAHDLLQLMDVRNEGLLVDVHGLVRTERGANLGLHGGIGS